MYGPEIAFAANRGEAIQKITRNQTVTMCNDEIARARSLYPHVEMLIGLAQEAKPMSILAERQFAFVHCDLGFQFAKEILELSWERLSPGARHVQATWALSG